MQERESTETLETSWDPRRVNKDRAQGWGSDDTTLGWVSASILHALRNPLGTICAGAELLMDLDSASTQVKRLAANLCRAAARMRQMLEDLTSVGRDNELTPELCDIRQVIAAAAETASPPLGRPRIQILLDVPIGIEVLLVR